MLFAFDFDGVIVDSFDHNISLMNRVCREFDLPDLFDRDRVRACDTMTWEFVSERCGVPETCRSSFTERLFELLTSVPPETRLFAGLPEVLRVARKLGNVVVITSNFESLTRDVLDANNLSDVVEQIFGAETSVCKTDKLRLAAQEYGVQLCDTVKIGDCISDIRHAREVGARSIGVGWGFHSSEQLAAENPDALVSEPQELAALLRLWAGGDMTGSCSA